MKILSITAGAAGMYCGSCLRDNTLALELKRMGHDVILLPIYTPTLTDQTNVSQNRVFFGGISVYLQQSNSFFRQTPWFIDRILDSNWLLNLFSGFGIQTSPQQLGALTLSMLQGENGFQKKELTKLVEWLRQETPPDIINLPNSLLIGLAQPLKAALKRPVICTLQGEDLFLRGLPEPYQSKALKLIRSKVKSIDGFIAVSDYCAGHMQSLLEIPRNRLHTVPLGIQTECYGNNHPLKSEIIRIGFLSRISPEKGLHTLCEAYKQLRLRKDVPSGKLNVAGYLGSENKAYLKSLQSKMSQWGLSKEFNFHGTLDQKGKIRFFENIDIFSVPATFEEPKGIPVLEAMASGIPVVQPSKGAYTEIVEKTDGGILTDSNSSDSLEKGIYSLYKNRQLAKTLGQNGKKGVCNFYDSSHMASAAMEIFTDIATKFISTATHS